MKSVFARLGIPKINKTKIDFENFKNLVCRFEKEKVLKPLRDYLQACGLKID